MRIKAKERKEERERKEKNGDRKKGRKKKKLKALNIRLRDSMKEWKKQHLKGYILRILEK